MGQRSVAPKSPPPKVERTTAARSGWSVEMNVVGRVRDWKNRHECTEEWNAWMRLTDEHAERDEVQSQS